MASSVSQAGEAERSIESESASPFANRLMYGLGKTNGRRLINP